MTGKLSTAIVMVVLLSMITTGVVLADEQVEQQRVRFIGEITEVDLDSSSFALHSIAGKNLRFAVGEQTVFRSRDGSIQGLSDLSVGMKALVSAIRDSEGDLLAVIVAASEANDLPEIKRSAGTITTVNAEESSFVLHTNQGQLQEYAVGSRTRYRSRDGSVQSLSDIEPGMAAVVVSLDREDQIPLALLIGVARSDERPKRFTVIGEIIDVVPGQGTFDLETRNGRMLSFSVTERTKFRSRDGSIEDIHDLKKGMHAIVVGVWGSEGTIFALGVAAVDPDDINDLPKFDLRALGRITSIGDQTFTIETRNQGSLTFSVDGSTRYISRRGNVESLEDLQIGMIAAVGAKELGNGDLKAILVGVGVPQIKRSAINSEVLPGRTPINEGP